MTRGRHILGAGQPLPPDFGVGKWSRIATFGPKKQVQADGSVAEWNFTPELFQQAVENYARMFSQRRLGSDYEHQARFAPLNGRPAPNLCFWDGMACVVGDRVVAIQEQQPGAPPEPAALRALLVELFPNADPDPGGLWARCSEVTELGRLLIPSYEQLSPLFSEAQLDESGEEIGFAVSNISFVNVAHQDGTFFNFSAALNFTDTALHRSSPERTSMDPEMLKKLGLAEGCSDKAAMRKAFAAYLEATSDGPEERKAMKAALAAKFGDEVVTIAHDGDGDGKLPTPADKDALADKAAMSAQQQALAALSTKHQAAEAKLAQLEAREQARETQARTQRLATFASSACSPVSSGGTGQWDPAKRADLEALCAALPEEKWPQMLGGVPKGTFGGTSSSPRLFKGGSPAGGRAAAGGGGFAPAYALQSKTVGFGATQQAFALLEQQGVKNPDAQQLAGALRQVAAPNPDVLREALAPSF